MSIRSIDQAGGGPNGNGTSGGFHFEASDVTGSNSLVARDVPRSSPAGEVALSLAARMALPTNVPWALRDDRTGGFLDDKQEIGEQIQSGSRVTVTPKTHLG